MDKDHEHVAHPNFARGQETEEHEEHHDEPRPDFARGNREGSEVTTESERGTYAEGKHVHDAPQGDFARGSRDAETQDENST